MSRDALRIRIGDCVVTCENEEDAAILRPVDEIVAGGSVEDYSTDQLERMVVTLERYDHRTGRLRTV
jgi:hypothetical protein